MTTSPSASAVAAQVASAWRRWQQRSASQAASSSTQRSADEETQFELVAVGLAAAISDAQLEALFASSSSDNSSSLDALSLLLPLEPAFTQDPQQFHFTLVVVAKLFAIFLEQHSTSAALESDRIVRELLLPLLQRQRCARVHAVALAMLEQIVQSPPAAAPIAIETLASDLSALLITDSSVHAHVSESAPSVSVTSSDDDVVSFSALCSALQLVLERSSSDSLTTAALVAQTKRVCLDAIARFATAPLLLRAVATQLVPSLLRLDATSAKALTDCAVATWRAAAADRYATAHIANVLYVLCLLVPSDATLVRDRGVQDLIAFALASSDALLRKQSMFVLHAAFAHYAASSSSSVLTTWQRFLTASDVIQMHEQLHLLEQVWPHVTELLESSLVVSQTNSECDVVATATATASAWPVTMSFDWLQSLLLRVFSHENPLVRRTFMQRFMDTCVTQWDAVGAAAVDTTASFACSGSFHAFVQTRLLRALNDAQMYKTSTKDAFMRSATAFLAAYLAFTLTHKTKSSSSASALSQYVDAVQDAVFGTWGVPGHSPEALVSMLGAFHSHALQQTVQQDERVDRGDLLNARALDQLRIMMEFRVMRSFPQSIRLQITHAIVQALTRGFTDAAAHSLLSLASVLLVLPLRNVVGDDGSTYVELHHWLRATSSVARFESALRLALTQFVRPASASSSATGRALSAHHLSRLLLFMSDVHVTLSSDAPVTVTLAAPLASLVAPDVGSVDSRKLLALVGTFEADVAQVQDLAQHTTTRFQFAFTPKSVYGVTDENTDAASVFSASGLFALGVRESSEWLDRVLAAAGRSNGSNTEQSKDDDDDDANDRDDATQRLAATALVVAQMATYAMEETGDLTAMDALDRLCVSLKQVLAPETALTIRASDQTLAMQYLAVVASRSAALDSLHSLQGESTLPLLLAAQLPPSTATTSSSSKRYKRCTIQFFESRWTLIHSVLRAASYISTPLLQRVFTECLDALAAVGADPTVLYELVQVLALALQQLAVTVVRADDRDAHLDALFQTVWGEYSACLAKPDALTRAVIYCLFQPAFLLTPALCDANDALMKRWVHRVLTFGQVHRPNVVFHLTCRLAQVWRAQPSAAHWFVDEIATLLLYREPVIDEKEQLTLAPGSVHGATPATATAVAAQSVKTTGLEAKDRFVRLVVLSLLDEISVEGASDDAPERALVETLIMRLLERNLTEEWCKQHMLNSDGFGQKLRCWQALCVLSKHVRSHMVSTVNSLLWRAFVYPHLPAMRYYMELFAMRLLVRFPDATIRDHVVPLLRDYNLTPQVGASLLLVAGYAVHRRLDATLARDHALCALLVNAMVPWLNASHGHTRILVQFLLAVVLPRYLHQTTTDAATDATGRSSGDAQLLHATAAFLSENKEAKRMHRRQLAQLRKFRPEFECSLLGVLASAHVNEFLELVPPDDVLVFSAQFKDTMNALHAQFNREHFVEDAPPRTTATAPSASTALGLVHVQRKIDTSAVLLDDSVLPVAMQARSGTTELDTVNVRNKRRQPVILCASLVDKTPNLAGLARTCEIFNAQALVVPNARVCDDALFSTISVTASKWMPIEQVRPDNGELVRALASWKRDGYTIVALEQTASSVCLSTVAFPEKIVIVLGKEKEGVPVDVLQMVDICVEIPQFGLIRSLNVHVSGAILLWEYTQQRMLQSAATVV